MLAQSYEEILIPPNISVEKVENKSKIQKKRRDCLTSLGSLFLWSKHAKKIRLSC